MFTRNWKSWLKVVFTLLVATGLSACGSVPKPQYQYQHQHVQETNKGNSVSLDEPNNLERLGLKRPDLLRIARNTGKTVVVACYRVDGQEAERCLLVRNVSPTGNLVSNETNYSLGLLGRGRVPVRTVLFNPDGRVTAETIDCSIGEDKCLCD